jgi:peptidoglycan/xylan/chitin deacetylase (PgdA/CDA1 family)
MRLDLVAGAAAAAWFGPAAAPVARPVATAFRIPCRLSAGRGVALTFDDGPHHQGTPAVLEALAAEQAIATFFLVGEQVERHRTLAAEIVAAGHAIGIHGHSHDLLLRRSPRAVHDDLHRARDVIGSATNTEPRLYRPPFGVFSGPALLVVRRFGWQPLLWSQWGRDWEARATPDEIAARVTRRLGDGDVVLLHDADHYSSPDSWRRTVAALPIVLEAAAAAGLPLVAASQST